MTSHFIVLVFALVLSILASLGVPSPRVNLLAAAFACFIASLLL